MNDGETTLEIIRPERTNDFIEFWTWLSKATKLRLKLVGWAGVIVPFVAIVYYVTGIYHNLALHLPFATPSLDQAVRFSYGAQIVVVFLLLILHGVFITPEKDEKFEYGTEGQDRLWFWWTIALFSFLLLYASLWVKAGHYSDAVNSVLGVASNLCNNLSTIAFLMCFSAMENPEKARQGAGRNWVVLWGACLIMVTLLEALVRFQYPHLISTWTTDWFDLLTGASAGVALSMFCGRLCSPLINLQVSAIVPLNLYAVVQISFGFWAKQQNVAILMANACLILKCFLAFVIAWLLTTRHLIFYMERVQKTKSELEKWRNEFRRRPITLIKAAPRDPG